MKKYLNLLRNCALFKGIDEQDIPGLLGCLGAKQNSCGKGQPVLVEGAPADSFGIVLEGSLQVVREDYYGNRSLLAVVYPGELFAEAFACAGVEHIPVSVLAAEDSRVLMVECHRVLTLCGNACGFHSRLVSNLLQVVAQKNLTLNRKIEFMSRKTTREKLMAYLLSQAKAAGSKEFTIPYDRQELADYLGVERSAMSAELSKLQKEGILQTTRSRFTLL